MSEFEQYQEKMESEFKEFLNSNNQEDGVNGETEENKKFSKIIVDFTKDVLNNQVVYGVPARLMKMQTLSTNLEIFDNL